MIEQQEFLGMINSLQVELDQERADNFESLKGLYQLLQRIVTLDGA